MIQDRLVVGIRDCKLSKRLQMDAELTLEKVVRLPRESEANKSWYAVCSRKRQWSIYMKQARQTHQQRQQLPESVDVGCHIHVGRTNALQETLYATGVARGHFKALCKSRVVNTPCSVRSAGDDPGHLGDSELEDFLGHCALTG